MVASLKTLFSQCKSEKLSLVQRCTAKMVRARIPTQCSDPKFHVLSTVPLPWREGSGNDLVANMRLNNGRHVEFKARKH